MADVGGKLRTPFDFELFKQNHFSRALTVLDVLSSKPHAGAESTALAGRLQKEKQKSLATFEQALAAIKKQMASQHLETLRPTCQVLQAHDNGAMGYSAQQRTLTAHVADCPQRSFCRQALGG
ncbi:unnamed protein product [Symbiodinium pilosum]|uniref:Uncharacterized protein n=1 Tax=Symbiodinium pilosum TaxID=2952 RepID=A0A812IUI2_SYMPI|nr:unnamed protein product [Symbiodinium pilosum]